VNSESIRIQGSYRQNTSTPKALTSLHALAIGGPFLGDNVLTIRTLDGEVKWNQHSILSVLGTDFHNKYIDAEYHTKSELVSTGQWGPGLDIDLPNGVSLIVNRWKSSLAVKITMCSSETGQDGQCGNNNINHLDDTPALIEERAGAKVPKALSLFPGGGAHQG